MDQRQIDFYTKVRISFDPMEYFGIPGTVPGQKIEFDGYVLFARKMRQSGKTMIFVEIEKENGEKEIVGFDKKYVNPIPGETL
jgi:hypothetical protein